MNKLKITTIAIVLSIGFAGCTSQKVVQKPAEKTSTEIVYTSDNTLSAEETELAPEVITKPEPVIHIVQKGESLWVIAKKYGVTVKALAEANNIENTSLIKINQELVIPEVKKK